MPRLRVGLQVEAFLLGALVRVGIRSFSVPRLARGLAALPRQRTGASPDSVDHCASAATMAARQAAHPTCLYRALVAFALLARRDRDAVLHLGASPRHGFSAHAWVTESGESLDPPGAREYVSIWRQPARVPRPSRGAPPVANPDHPRPPA